MDFGIARAVADTSATMTQTAAVIGTAQYLSPEQARGETVDARSDIYSAGCLLYELLVGRPPFTGESPVSVAYQHVREAPVPPSAARPGDHPRDRGGDPQGAGQGSRRPLPVGAGDEGRHHPRAGRAADHRDGAAGRRPMARPLALDTPTRVVAPAPIPVIEDDGDIDEPPKRRAGLIVLITALIVLVLGIGAFALYQVLENQTPAVVKVEVPDLQGYKEAQAAEQLAGRKLVMAVERVNGDEESKDTIIAQSPRRDPGRRGFDGDRDGQRRPEDRRPSPPVWSARTSTT